jgi:DNA-binding CsgD family transcriptional regulator
MNPWNLTDREQETLTTVSNVGSSKLAARELGLSPRTVEIYLSRARFKMDTTHTITAVVKWTRYVINRSAKHEEAE